MRSTEGVKVSLTPQEQTEIVQACQRLNCTVPHFFKHALCYLAACKPQALPDEAPWPSTEGRVAFQVRLPPDACVKLRGVRSTLPGAPPLGVYCGAWVMVVLRSPERLDAALGSTQVLVAPSTALKMSEIPEGGSDGC